MNVSKYYVQVQRPDAVRLKKSIYRWNKNERNKCEFSQVLRERATEIWLSQQESNSIRDMYKRRKQIITNLLTTRITKVKGKIKKKQESWQQITKQEDNNDHWKVLTNSK